MEELFIRFQLELKQAHLWLSESKHREMEVKNLINSNKNNITQYRKKATYWLEKEDEKKAKEYLGKVFKVESKIERLQKDLNKLSERNEILVATLKKYDQLLQQRKNDFEIWDSKSKITELNLEAAINELHLKTQD